MMEDGNEVDECKRYRMNLKLNNERQGSACARAEPLIARASIKEERRRTGRYIAILVGVSLLFLALYQAWVRRIPVVASLIVPALIMFGYIAWVLYTASRDKRNRERDLERAHEESSSLTPMTEPAETPQKLDVDLQLNNITTSVNLGDRPRSATPSPAHSFTNVSFDVKCCGGIKLLTDETTSREDDVKLMRPIILVNDEPHASSDERLAGEGVAEEVGGMLLLRKQRLKSPAVFRRSYSIA